MRKKTDRNLSDVGTETKRRERHIGGRDLKRAAFTVEAALIMPVILMVLLSVLYLCLHEDSLVLDRDRVLYGA